MRAAMMFFSSLLFALSAQALEPGDKVDNFELQDHTGKTHELQNYSDMEAVVIMIQGNGCPIARNAIASYDELREMYGPQDVEFLMLNANLQDTQEAIAEEAEEFSIDFPILVDESQSVAETFYVERTADTFVIDPDDWTLRYRGSLDDRLNYEGQLKEAEHTYVADALDAIIAGEQIEVTKTDPRGCLVAMPGLASR